MEENTLDIESVSSRIRELLVAGGLWYEYSKRTVQGVSFDEILIVNYCRVRIYAIKWDIKLGDIGRTYWFQDEFDRFWDDLEYVVESLKKGEHPEFSFDNDRLEDD